MIAAGGSPRRCCPAGRAARNVPLNFRTAPRQATLGRRCAWRAVTLTQKAPTIAVAPEPLRHRTNARCCSRPSRAGRSAAGWRRFSALASWLLLTLFLCVAARAADLPYTLAIAPTGEPRLDQAIEDTSQLVRFKDRAPVGPFALIGRAEAEPRASTPSCAASATTTPDRDSGSPGSPWTTRPCCPCSKGCRRAPGGGGGRDRPGAALPPRPRPAGRSGARTAGRLSTCSRAARPRRRGPGRRGGRARALREDGFALAQVPPPDARGGPRHPHHGRRLPRRSPVRGSPWGPSR